MEYCKMQIGCIMVILYVVFMYVRESRRYHQWKTASLFNLILVTGLVSVVFDGLTAYTVNHLDEVSSICNMIFHMVFLLALDSFIFLVYIYLLSITEGIPKNKRRKFLICLPYMMSVVIVIAGMPLLEYREGALSNYSMGLSAYTCFALAIIYILRSLYNFFKRWVYIENHKRWSIVSYLLVMAVITMCQIINPELLLTSICATIIILGIYLTQENPSVIQLTQYHEEMIMGFATLVENKDGSTGGHIKRTSMYVKLLVRELRKKGHYKDVLTKDYVNDLYLAAPMHDIGKISIPDEVLQKPGKLTEEEFGIMKQHTTKGGKIIEETFGHLGNKSYTNMAYQVAKYHHEKWNGKGYPEGLAGEEIPLCARIMAIADVFDAVSEKRCYRDAMPIDKCFEIIEEGKGRDFEPLLVDTFLGIREKVEKIHNEQSLRG